MDLEDCRYLLRALELDAFASLLSAFRAQGALTDHKRMLLDHVRAALSISVDRYRSEIRRVTADPLTNSIAKQLNPLSDDIYDWIAEGRSHAARTDRLDAALPTTERLIADDLCRLIAKHNKAENVNQEKLFELAKTPKRVYVPELLRSLLIETEAETSKQTLTKLSEPEQPSMKKQKISKTQVPAQVKGRTQSALPATGKSTEGDDAQSVVSSTSTRTAPTPSPDLVHVACQTSPVAAGAKRTGSQPRQMAPKTHVKVTPRSKKTPPTDGKPSTGGRQRVYNTAALQFAAYHPPPTHMPVAPVEYTQQSGAPIPSGGSTVSYVSPPFDPQTSCARVRPFIFDVSPEARLIRRASMPGAVAAAAAIGYSPSPAKMPRLPGGHDLMLSTSGMDAAKALTANMVAVAAAQSSVAPERDNVDFRRAPTQTNETSVTTAESLVTAAIVGLGDTVASE